jgi:outer membrane receptor for ferrienterochelin and colicins
LVQQVNADPEDIAGAYGGIDMVSLATGYTRPLFDAPVSASIVSRRDIEDSGARNLAELLQTVTSYYVVSPDGGRTTFLAVRGLESRVLILVDNVPLYQGLYNGIFGIQDLPLDNVERVEITRGPGSALYGADAVAGVVNIITRTSLPAVPKEVGTRIGNLTTIGGYGIDGADFGGLHLSFYGGYNQSAATNRILQADAQSAFDTAFHTDASLAPGRIDDGIKSVDARVELASEHWRLRATWHNEFDVGNGIGIAEALDPGGRASNQVGNVELIFKNPISPKWDLSGYLVYTDVTQTARLTLYPPGAFLNHFPKGVLQNIDEDENRVRGEGTAIYSSHKNRVLLSAGVFTEDAHTTLDVRNYIVTHAIVIPTGFFAPGAGVGAPLLVGNRGDTVVYGVVQDEWSFAPDFSLIAGLRLDDYNHFGAQWSPRAALVWTPTQRTTVKLLYNEAFRPPSVVETSSNGTFAALGNSQLQPSKTRMEELQLGYRLLAVEVTASAFRYKTNSLIVTTTDIAAPLGLAYVNGESDQAFGIDGEVRWHLIKTLSLSVNGMAQRHTSASENFYIAESPPKKLVNVTADWAFAAHWNLYASGSGVFGQGRAVSDTRPTPGNYGLLSMAIKTSALPQGLVATFRATNALNKYYVQSSNSAVAVPSDIPQPGREVTLQVTKSF